MKNSQVRRNPLVVIVALISVVALCFTGIGCDTDPNPGYYHKVSNSKGVSGGGELKVYLERQKEGQLNGDTLSIRYYIYDNYTGSKTVEEIRATWTIKAEYRRLVNSSFKAGIAEKSYGHSGSCTSDCITNGCSNNAETEWELYVEPSREYELSPPITATLWWSNTNGSKDVYYGASTYILYPYKQLEKHTFQSTASLKIKGVSTPTTVSVTV